jgi:predicted deacylase
MNRSLELFGVSADPGKLAFGSIKIGELADGAEIKVPFMIMNGSTDGPTLFIEAAIHGTEVTGIEVIRRIMREDVKPGEVHGAIIAVPIANPLTFSSGAYNHSPVLCHHQVLNPIQSFPGSPVKSITERLTSTLGDLIEKADCFIDLHCDTTSGDMRGVPFLAGLKKEAIGSAETHERAIKLARAFGLTIVLTSIENDLYARTGPVFAMRKKIPSFVVEFPDWRVWTKGSILVGVKGVKNVMKHLGMLEGVPEKQDSVPVCDDILEYVEIYVNRGGLLHPEAQPGRMMSRGDLLARVRNAYGDIVEEITAPRDGMVLTYGLWVNQGLMTGDCAMDFAAIQN